MKGISVLMSVYQRDRPEYFRAALDSILRQTYAPDEIVVIIDGEVDRKIENILEDEVRDFRGKFIVHRNPRKLGLPRSLNIGLKLATNELIARMDSDDVSLPDRFERQVEVLSSRPEISLVGGWYRQFEESMTKSVTDRKVPETMEEIVRFSKRRTPINHVTVLFYKNAVEKIKGYREKDGLFEDWWLALDLIKEGYTLYNIQDYLVNVRGGADFFGRRGGMDYLKSEIKTLLEMHADNLLSGQDAVVNILLRMSVRIIPTKLRTLVYRFVRTAKT